VLTVAGLTVTYGNSPVVNGVDFALADGEALGLVGESGCGKSTIARALVQILPRSARIEGEMQMAGKIGLIFQDPMTRLNPLLTVMEHGTETLRCHFPHLTRRQAERQVKETLTAVKIDPDRAYQYPHELSGGMRQRVMIALVLLTDPLILIADEPTTSLDISVAQAILTVLDQLRRERGMGLILISHDLGLIAQYCDRVAVMQSGTIVEIGTVAQVIHQPRHPYSQYLLKSVIHWGESAEREGADQSAMLLRVRDLCKSYRLGWRKTIQAVDQLSLDIQRGEIFGIIGESGSGKSTTARLILQLIRADRGSVCFDGVELRGLAPSALRRLRPQMQMIFQDPRACFHPYLSLLASVSDALTAYGIPRQTAIAEALAMLERVGIAPSMAQRYPSQLSGGQLQRAAIARALILKPRFLVCDEPVSMLDATIQRQVLDLLVQLQREFQLTYLFITHDLAVAQFLCDRVAVMHQGRIVEQGASGDIFARPQHPYTQSLMASFPHLN
jgi:peptide/nickel transport system ATP-binding protein